MKLTEEICEVFWHWSSISKLLKNVGRFFTVKEYGRNVTAFRSRVAESAVICPTFPKFPNPTHQYNANELWLSTIL